MSNPSSVMQIRPQDLLLNPNNPRLAHSLEWHDLPDARIPALDVQRATRLELTRLGRFPRSELRESIFRLGWRQSSPLIVRKLSNGQLLLLDGNLRVAYLQDMVDENQLELDFKVSVTEILSVDDPSLGLHHIVTTHPWSRLAAALWREKRTDLKENLPISGSLLRFGRVGYASWNDEDAALELCRGYIQSANDIEDPRDVFDAVLDLLRSRAFSAWLRTETGQLDNARVSRFLSWYVSHEEDDRVVDGTEPAPETNRLPTLRSRAQARLSVSALNYVFGDPILTDLVNQGKNPYSLYQTRFEERNQPLGVGIYALADQRWVIETSLRAAPLRSVNIKQYRGLANLHIDNLSTINLFVGPNNAGKTSVLEAIHVIAHMSDPRGVIETIETRIRKNLDQDPQLLGELLKDVNADLSAVTNSDQSVTVTLRKDDAPPPDADVATFVTRLYIEAQVRSARQHSVSTIQSNGPRRTMLTDGTASWLAASVLHSPFAAADSAHRATWYKETVLSKTLGDLVSLIQKNIDPDITDIRLVDKSGRFLVEHNKRQPLDLSSYGEGLQRFFEIGLLFSAHRNGIVLIDEVETAIHTSALPGLARMIFQLAQQFSVQVFITTHSNETIGAFVDGEQAGLTVAFGMYREDEKITVFRYDGTNLSIARAATDLDIRRQ